MVIIARFRKFPRLLQAPLIAIIIIIHHPHPLISNHYQDCKSQLFIVDNKIIGYLFQIDYYFNGL